MASYYNVPQPEKATPAEYEGCLSGFMMIPLMVVGVSAILFFSLAKITTVSKASLKEPDLSERPEVFIPPYDDYTLTQGPHGYSYGHMAIDIAAGKGATILSPINGTVTELFTDGVGNPSIIIENEIFRITMLHGVYSAHVGQTVKAGQSVGSESNLGNTTDMQGRSCRNRDCGYHTHLNVYDKRINANINPLDLLED